MKKYSYIMMAFALLLGMAQCKKEPATPNGDNNGGVRITLKVDDGPSTPSTGSGTESGTDDGEKLNVYPATGAVIFTQGDKIYVGNNGKYVGTLTFDNGLFQGTINDDLCSTTDYLHFYFVGNKPTTPSTLGAGTTTYTVNISDQSTGLPAISYAPSTAKYSPSTTAYTAKLLNKSALVKFVPSLATSQPITVSGLKNEVQIDFANHTLAPSGTTGGITLYSVSDTEKWAILLAQEAVSDATVTIRGYDASASLPPITNNMYYNSGVGISMTAAYVTYEANNSNWESVLASFNAEPSPNPMLELTGNITINNTGFAITRADGTIDLKGYTLGTTHATHALFLQNNVLDKSLTIMNGTINAPVDGNVGWTDWYCGTVIFENITFKREVFFDGHLCELTNVNFAADSMFENYTGGSGNPGLVIINSGKFNCTFHANGDYRTKGATTIYGGKFSTNPSSIANVTIPEGYSIRSNTDSDSGTYPYIVCEIPTGAIGGEFTINGSGGKVYFSKGNLQYKGGTGWRFAEHQYDYVGAWNTSDWVDWYLWGTWSEGQNPLLGSSASFSWSSDFDGTLTNASSSDGWRILSSDEWTYVYNTRSTTSGIRFAKAIVNNNNGIILLPDNWNSSIYSLNNTNTNDAAYSSNTISADDWANTFKFNGAVFLPAAGRRWQTSPNDVGSVGRYWTATHGDSNNKFFEFTNGSVQIYNNSDSNNGNSIRLVCPVD